MVKSQIISCIQRLFTRRKRTIPEIPDRSSEPESLPLRSVREVKTSEPSSASHEQIVAMTRESGKKRLDLLHFQHLSDGVLLPLLPSVQHHCEGLPSAVERYNEEVEQANRWWESERNKIGRLSGVTVDDCWHQLTVS
jgi:hypothetical protein